MYNNNSIEPKLSLAYHQHSEKIVIPSLLVLDEKKLEDNDSYKLI